MKQRVIHPASFIPMKCDAHPFALHEEAAFRFRKPFTRHALRRITHQPFTLALDVDDIAIPEIVITRVIVVDPGINLNSHWIARGEIINTPCHTSDGERPNSDAADNMLKTHAKLDHAREAVS